MGRISVCKRFEFDAAHHLPEYDGKCKNVHGHHYLLDVEITGPVQMEHSQKGMILDFGYLKTIVNKFIIDQFDHTDLNVTFPHYPTAEIMVRWIAAELDMRLQDIGIKLVRVRLYETPTAYAEWKGDI